MPTFGQSKGGKVTAERSRQRAIERYYQNPNRCLDCDAVIPVQPGQKVADVREKKFCDHSCSARYNNKKRRLEKTDRSWRNCLSCDKKTQTKTGLCLSCLTALRSDQRDQITKGEMYAKRSGYQSGRTGIRIHAGMAFAKAGKPQCCAVCGYDTYIEVCHIRAVKDFPDTATLGEINHPENLVALCPNHHWELDNGILLL